jgi:hypothetical protein
VGDFAMAIQIGEGEDIIWNSVKTLPKEELALLYAQYVARFLSDNGRIWVTGSIMIPLGLSGFALISTIKDPTLWRLVPVAIVSTAIILIWNWIADHHRAFQDRSMAWIVAIEKVLIERSGASYPVFVKIGAPLLSVRLVRWSLVAIVVLAWVVVLVGWSI